MSVIKPFPCVRPTPALASAIAALPYDVYNREEAKRKVQGDDNTFLRIDRPETQFPDTQDMYAPEVYQKAAEMLVANLEDGVSFFEVQLTDPDEYDELYRGGGVADVLEAANDILEESGSEDRFSDSVRFYLVNREMGCIMAVCALEKTDLSA